MVFLPAPHDFAFFLTLVPLKRETDKIPKSLTERIPRSNLIGVLPLPAKTYLLFPVSSLCANKTFPGRLSRASVLYDVACDKKTRPWKDVHRIFYEAMRIMCSKSKRLSSIRQSSFRPALESTTEGTVKPFSARAKVRPGETCKKSNPPLIRSCPIDKSARQSGLLHRSLGRRPIFILPTAGGRIKSAPLKTIIDGLFSFFNIVQPFAHSVLFPEQECDIDTNYQQCPDNYRLNHLQVSNRRQQCAPISMLSWYLQ